MFFRKLFPKKGLSFFKKPFHKLVPKKSSKTDSKKSLLNQTSSVFQLEFFSSLFKNSYSWWQTFLAYSEKPFSVIKKNQKLLLSLLIAFLISDLLLIASYKFLLPEKELPLLKLSTQNLQKKSSPESYQSLWKNNIFHTGPIPLKPEEESVVSLDPVLSSLPFKLKGTIIHANPKRSVATITGGPENETLSYQQGDIIADQAEIRNIQRAKVIFFNQNNNRLEYILIPEEKNTLSISYKEDKIPKVKPYSSESKLVKQTGPNQFQVKRSDVNEYLQNLPEVLQQARVVPYRSEIDGEIIGFRFSSIDQGSVFEELGFQKGDIIKEVDGETVTDPEKALELFDKLKGSSGFKILVQREDKDIYYEYGVRENAPIN